MSKFLVRFLRLLILTFLVGSVIGLYAETGFSTTILTLQDSLAAHPDDLNLRIMLGYNLMLENQPLLALREYKTVVQTDKRILAGWQGLVWAYNGNRNWHQAILTGKQALQLYPADPALFNLTGSAYWNAYNSLAARECYSKGLIFATRFRDTYNQSEILKGLGKVYLVNGDYLKAQKALKSAQAIAIDTTLTAEILYSGKVKHLSNLSCYYLPEKTVDVSVAQSLLYKSLSAQIGIEQYRIDSKTFRNSWSLGVGKQFTPFTVNLKAFYLTGEGNQYPAKCGHIKLSEHFFLEDMLLTPDISVAVSEYPDFNVYQGEASLALNMQKLILTCRYGQTYRDVLSPDADYYKSALHLSVSYPYYRFFYIALLAGTGNQDWWVTPSGFIIDDYNSESSYLANTISIPLNHKTDFTWYHKFMERDDTWQYAFGISLTGRY